MNQLSQNDGHRYLWSWVGNNPFSPLEQAIFGVIVPSHCVEPAPNLPSGYRLRRECFCPPVGWVQPVALCGHPGELMLSLEGKSVGDECYCRGAIQRGVLRLTGSDGNQVDACDKIQVWAIESIDANCPDKSLVRFVTWADRHR